MDLEALDFIVVNQNTGNPIAAFLLPTDAVRFIEYRRASEPAPGRQYAVKNADGSPTSPQLADRVDRANETVSRVRA